jgi:hypothetical protein
MFDRISANTAFASKTMKIEALGVVAQGFRVTADRSLQTEETAEAFNIYTRPAVVDTCSPPKSRLVTMGTGSEGHIATKHSLQIERNRCINAPWAS